MKIYRDRKPTGTYYRVCYHLGGKRLRLNFADLEKAKDEAEAKAAQLSRGDVDAMLKCANIVRKLSELASKIFLICTVYL